MEKLPYFLKSPHVLANKACGNILVGLSGGADSVALLHMLTLYAKNYGCKIYAAHVNHNIRLDDYNNEALRDENFCRELCKSLNVTLFVKSIDVPSMAKNEKVSLEGAARDARYSFFSEIMNTHDIKILALAHNANDCLETQIFNLARGSSLQGIIGIREVRSIENVEDGVLVRPILSATKDEIYDYCKNNSLNYMLDSTNMELDATRNKIRHNIIPKLNEIFPSCLRSSRRLSESIEECDDYITSVAKEYIEKNIKLDGDVCIDISSFESLHTALKKKILAVLLDNINISYDRTHIDDMIALISKKKPNSYIYLPCEYRFKIIDNNAYIYFEECKEEKNFKPFNIKLEYGMNYIENSDFSVGIYNDGEEYDGYVTYAYVHIGNGELYAKSRESGDVILDGGNSKKIKKLMCDKKIPQSERNSLPIIMCNGEVIYLPFCAICDSVKHGGEKIKICIYKNKGI